VKDVFKPYRIDVKGEPVWSGVYVIGQRLASGYEGAQGRAFIVGDACKSMQPTKAHILTKSLRSYTFPPRRAGDERRYERRA
jgi:hypothetical protein